MLNQEDTFKIMNAIDTILSIEKDPERRIIFVLASLAWTDKILDKLEGTGHEKLWKGFLKKQKDQIWSDSDG